ncbi:MAG: hypothetical protein AMK69_01470 [Nitrospira bacterium SG8_3]|nr:MAG: hypothetical protein AMK69_01470 [Nitrospira bacterium SG8_3]
MFYWGFNLTLSSSIVIVWDIDHTASSLWGKPLIWASWQEHGGKRVWNPYLRPEGENACVKKKEKDNAHL